jgi:FAD/FMN-containing dehydrogenase
MTQSNDLPPVPPVPPHYFANTAPVVQDWAGMVRFEPSLYFTPRSVDELKTWLQGALKTAAPGSAIRVLGGLHSCAEICETDIVIDTTALPQTLEWAPDNASVTASANWHLHDFLWELAQRGKSIAATGGTDAQTLAGLISTNTAPATPAHTVYETLEWVEYLTLGDDGTSVVEKRVARGEPGFQAAVCSLGAIGILTRVGFGVIDQPFFSTIQKIVPLNEVLADLDRTSQQYDFWRIDWVPDTEQGLLWAAWRIPPAGVDPNGDYPVDQSEGVLRFLMKVVERLQDNGPFLSTVLEVV